MTVTWDNPSSLHTVSNGGLTLTQNTSGSWGCSESQTVRATGKLYWEIKIDYMSGNARWILGAAAQDCSQYPGQSGATAWGYIGYSGEKVSNGSFATYGSVFASGDVIGVAVDLSAGKIWFSKNGTWQASGDPSAGTNPAYTGVSGNVRPAAGGYDNTDQITGRFLATDLQYSPPSGFLPFEFSTTTLVKAVVQAYMEEGTIRVPLSQDYALLTQLLSSCSQLYGLQLLAKLIQYYGDAPVFRRILGQWYGSAAILRRAVEQPYADAKTMAAVLDQEWIGYGDMLAMLQQRYSISQGQLQAMAEQAYTIQERAILQRILDQLYITAPRDALVQRPAITVATADGEALDPHHISIEHDEGDLSVRAEIHLASQEQYLLCRHLETRVIITVDAEQWTLLVEAPSASRPAPGEESFVVPLVSPAVLLDAPYADTVDEEYTGMASAIVGGLAASAGVAVVWQLLDWYIPAGVLFANGETPLAVIRKIVAAVGGILQASPAGELICRPAYPLPVTSWATATPAAYLTDMDNFYSVTSSPEIRDGYNRYLVSDQDAAAAGLTLEEIEVDAQTKKIRVYQVPYAAAADIRLRTSGGDWVSIAADGTIDESLTELVEIVAGEGNCQHPIYSLASRSYKQRVLGTITIAEDGHLRTEIADNSLVEIVYTTRYRQFTVRSPQIEDVQFYPEEVAA